MRACGLLTQSANSMFCRECQYNLHGLPEPRCPECGHLFDPTNPATFDTHIPGGITRARRRYGQHVNVAIIVLLSLVALQTAIRIEVYNVLAGGYLPRTDFSFTHGNPKWRWWMWDTPAWWLTTLGPKDADGKPVTRPLTPEERTRMQREVREARVTNHLHGLVAGWGLLQYPCVLALFILSLRYRVKGGARYPLLLGIGGTTIAVACAILMVYRGYFTSPGY